MNGQQSTEDAALSPLMKCILAYAYEHACRATYAEILDDYFGEGLNNAEKKAGQASIRRARQRLVRRRLVEPVCRIFILTCDGWDIADQEAREATLPVIGNALDLARYRQMLESMRRVPTRRHAHRGSGGKRLRKPLIDMAGQNIEFA